MSPTTPTSQASGSIRLRFLFANHDGLTVELSVLPTTRVADVKHRLREVWPPALLTAERRRNSGSSSSSSSSSTHAPSSLQPRHHHHHHTFDDHEGGWSESEDEDDDEDDDEEEEDDDDGTVASCSGVGPPPSLRLRAPSVDRLRLICMGQGLMKDSRTLQECHIPVFTSHPTPVNVSIRPPPPRPPGQRKKGQQQKKKLKTLDDEEGGREGVGVIVPRGCVSCSIM